MMPPDRHDVERRELHSSDGVQPHVRVSHAVQRLDSDLTDGASWGTVAGDGGLGGAGNGTGDGGGSGGSGAEEPPPRDPAEPLFAGASIPRFELSLPQASIDRLSATPDAYVPGDLKVTADGRWNDMPCDATLPYVCKLP